MDLRPWHSNTAFSQLLCRISISKRPVNRFPKNRKWDHTMAIDFHDRANCVCCNQIHPIFPRWKWEQIGDDDACIRSEFLQNWRPMSLSCYVQGVFNTELFTPTVQIHGSIKKNAVMTSICVRVTFVNSLVNKERKIVAVCEDSTSIDGWIFVGSQG